MIARLRGVAKGIGSLEPGFVALAAPLLLFPTFRPRWTVAALVALLAVWLLRWIGSGRPGVATPGARTPMDVPLLVLSAMIPVAALISTAPELTLPKLTGLILGLAAFRATVHSIQSDHGLRWAIVIFLALGLGFAAVGLVGSIRANKLPVLGSILKDMPPLIQGLPGAEKGINANELGGTLTMFLPFSLAASGMRFSKRKWIDWPIRVATLLVALFVGTVLVFSQSRSAWVGGAVGLGAMAWLRWRWAPWLLIGAVLLALGLVYLAPQGILQPTLESTELDAIDSVVEGIEPEGRAEIWNRALYAIQDFPFTGCGLGTFRQVVPVLYPLFTIHPKHDIGHAHNVLLQVALDLGLPGLIAYLALVGIALWLAWCVARQPEGETRWLALGSLGALVAFHAYGLTDAIALGAKPGVAFWILVALTAAMWGIREGGGQDSIQGIEPPEAKAR